MAIFLLKFIHYLVQSDCVGQSFYGFNVQMIGRLVQNEKVGLMSAQNGEGHARLLPSREAANLKIEKEI